MSDLAPLSADLYRWPLVQPQAGCVTAARHARKPVERLAGLRHNC
ncbi:hypothetical protein NYV37_15925 [Escherichia coli]|nr:hypothetical protein [Escherichia coli]